MIRLLFTEGTIPYEDYVNCVNPYHVEQYQLDMIKEKGYIKGCLELYLLMKSYRHEFTLDMLSFNDRWEGPTLKKLNWLIMRGWITRKRQYHKKSLYQAIR